MAEVLEGTLQYRSNGKLLLTGEYVVLDGAKALALPTKYGQRLIVEENDFNTINWKSYDELGNVWFEDEISYDNLATSKSIETHDDITVRLIQILKAAQKINPKFLSDKQGYNIITHQDFNRKWGLGTSSTLINNIANWANVDAYKLLAKTFSGSGYDIACAQFNSPITYQLINEHKRIVEPVFFNPSFKNQLYFVYLNQKQNSRDGISTYKKLGKVDNKVINKINQLTESFVACQSLSEFESLIDQHEILISKLIEHKSIKSQLFSDFEGSIKSLGAWGGDFVLVTSKTDPTDYFNYKGFRTVIPYVNMAQGLP